MSIDVTVGSARITLECTELQNAVGSTSQTYWFDDVLHAALRVGAATLSDREQDGLHALLAAARALLNPKLQTGNLPERSKRILAEVGIDFDENIYWPR